MTHDDRMDYSEGIVVNNASKSKECDICHYWYFLNKKFKFQSYVCNLVLMSIDLSDIGILNIKGAAYRCIISGTTKSDP